jgi:Bacterial regulatory helix-turn-helix protein, lysR family
MEMQQIRYFLALCNEQNFTRAAKRCGITQPSLTRAIKKLEMELGGPLFERSRRSCHVSRLGKVVQPHLVSVDRSVANAEREAAAFLSSSQAPPFKPKESPMRKIIYGAAIAAVALLLTVGVNLRPQLRATAASITPAGKDVSTLMSTIDVKALPRHDILSEADE